MFFCVVFFVLWCFQSLETDTPKENDDVLASHADVGTGTLLGTLVYLYN